MFLALGREGGMILGNSTYQGRSREKTRCHGERSRMAAVWSSSTSLPLPDLLSQLQGEDERLMVEGEAVRTACSQDAAELQALDAKINAILPPQYQHCYDDVQPVSMGSAGLKYRADGKVAWDEIWTSFCDLALAGGPPHRGTLLEAVPPEEALGEPEKY